MTRFAKILFLAIISNGILLSVFADRGIGKKSKSKIVLNVVAASSISIGFNLKSGLHYKGSLLNNFSTTGNTISYNSLVTYQKGNTIYILPYKQKVIVPEIRQGYTGLKLILKTN